MSVAMAMEATRDHLRTQLDSPDMQCGIQYRAEPPLTAAQWYVAIAELATESGSIATYSLKETLNIQIGLWRNTGHIARDRSGQASHETDFYRPQIKNLEKLERLVLQYVHQVWAIVNAANQTYELPSIERGATFLSPWRFVGRGPTETFGAASEGTVITFLGRRLRFTGFHREQLIGNVG